MGNFLLHLCIILRIDSKPHSHHGPAYFRITIVSPVRRVVNSVPHQLFSFQISSSKSNTAPWGIVGKPGISYIIHGHQLYRSRQLCVDANWEVHTDTWSVGMHQQRFPLESVSIESVMNQIKIQQWSITKARLDSLLLCPTNTTRQSTYVFHARSLGRSYTDTLKSAVVCVYYKWYFKIHRVRNNLEYLSIF